MTHFTAMAALTFLILLTITPTSILSHNLNDHKSSGGGREEVRVAARRWLGGPGSWPPTCRSKCGRCTPCEAVHVAVQPGSMRPLEYYPEAWRCKCGMELFMP